MKKVLLSSLGLVPVFLLWQTSAKAADHLNLEEGLPVQVEDAYPIEYRGRELQGQIRYERTSDRKDRVILDPRIEIGVARNAQVSISAPFQVGNDTSTGSRNLRLTGLYNFNTESLSVPAFAISARGEFPTGVNSAGFGTELKLIATKTLGTGANLDRLHVNVAWLHNTDPKDDERSDRYSAVLGYSRRLGPDMVLVTDFVREQDLQKGNNANVVELGVRRQVDPLTVLSVGAGVGIGEQSPGFRVTAAFQRSF
jgi:hypothetical protein